MKLLITGATGFLGSRALRCLRGGYDTATVPPALLRGALTTPRIRQLADAIASQKPDVLFHTAAISDVAYAGQHPEESYQANVTLSETLAGIASEVGCKFVFCSSDQVYGGCAGQGPFTEDAPLAPQTMYARHKLEAEARIAAAAPGAVALRLTWLYDLPAYRLPTHRNLLMQVLGAAARKQPLPLPAADFRGVTYAGQVLENLPKAFALPGGVYNFGSGGLFSTRQIAGAWREALGLAGLEFAPGEGAPRSLCMNPGKAEAAGIAFDDSCAGIRRCMRDYGLSER